MRALPSLEAPAQNTNTDGPHTDFPGRRLRLVSKQLHELGEEPSPLHEALVSYLESLP